MGEAKVAAMFAHYNPKLPEKNTKSKLFIYLDTVEKHNLH